MFGLFFTDQEKVTTFAQVSECDVAQFKAFFHGMLNLGYYFAPSAYEAGFVSQAHNETIIADTITAAARVLAKIE